MFDVTTINLSRDATHATPDLGSSHLGPLVRDHLAALLETFRQLDAIQNHDADPHIAVQTPTGKFLIRTGQGRLFLYNARDTAAPYAELNSEAILAELEKVHASEPDTETGAERTAPASKTPCHAISIAILLSGLLLNAYTVYSVFQNESVNQQPAVSFLSSGPELNALQQSAAGLYATGNVPGDRAIEILATGQIRFLKITPK